MSDEIYALWPVQARALDLLGLGDVPATVDELLFGGQAGPGKSLAARAAAVAIAYKWPGSVIPIFRRTYGELEEKLALDTPIPTPTGWTTMGELQTGDFVLSPNGKPVRITKAHPVSMAEKAYRVVFDTGDTIDACSNHLWKTFTARDRMRLRARQRAEIGHSMKPFSPRLPIGTVKTTEEIAGSIVQWGTNSNHSISVTEPIELPDIDLPLDPYLLGVWLGDGDTSNARITSADPEIPQAFIDAGFKLAPPRQQEGCINFGVYGLHIILRKEGLLGNKHVPPAYLRASRTQRLALLQGFMDTDGWASAECGMVNYTSIKRGLVEAVRELACSLGHKPRLIKETVSKLYEKDCGPIYHVHWTPPESVFRLPRKVARFRPIQHAATRSRYIVDCIPIEPVPMRCISVDDPDGLYLCGTAFITTHNSHIRKILQEVPDTEAKWNGERRELTFKNGSIIEFRHCDQEANVYRYLSAEWQGLMIDEATTFTPFMISLLRSRVRRPEDPERRAKLKGDVDSWGPRIMYCTNPGGEGHRYLKEGFVDHEGLGVPWTAPKDDGGLRRFFLRARLRDNPSLDEDSYQRVLEGIQDPVVRAAMAEGDWNIFGGQFFTQFRYDRHVCAPFQVPDDWLKWTGQDWGITAPSAGTWLAKVPPNWPITMTDGSVVRSERPRVVVYREWYQAGLSTDDQAMSLRYYTNGDNLSARYADPHLWDKKGSGGSYAEDFIENGWFITPANNDRKEGWARIHQMLNSHDMYPPELIIQSQCTTLIKALPEAPRDSNDVEDIDTHYKHDHVLDALRYACMGGRRVMKSMNRNMRGTYRVKGQAKDASDDRLFAELFGHKVTLMGSRR